MHVSVCANKNLRVCAYIYINVYICVYPYYIYVCVCVCVSLFTIILTNIFSNQEFASNCLFLRVINCKILHLKPNKTYVFDSNETHIWPSNFNIVLTDLSFLQLSLI